MRKGIPYGKAPQITITNAELVWRGDYFLDEAVELDKNRTTFFNYRHLIDKYDSSLCDI